MSEHDSFMKMAIQLSIEKMKAGEGGPFGAVIVQHGQIIGQGWNKVTSKNDPTAHAEVEAIRDACQNLKTFELKDAILYTSCEPCPMCLSAIYWARLSKYYFGNTRTEAAAIAFDDAFIYDEIPMAVGARKIPGIQLLSSEAHKAFELWQQSSQKVPY